VLAIEVDAVLAPQRAMISATRGAPGRASWDRCRAPPLGAQAADQCRGRQKPASERHVDGGALLGQQPTGSRSASEQPFMPQDAGGACGRPVPHIAVMHFQDLAGGLTRRSVCKRIDAARLAGSTQPPVSRRRGEGKFHQAEPEETSPKGLRPWPAADIVEIAQGDLGRGLSSGIASRRWGDGLLSALDTLLGVVGGAKTHGRQLAEAVPYRFAIPMQPLDPWTDVEAAARTLGTSRRNSRSPPARMVASRRQD